MSELKYIFEIAKRGDNLNKPKSSKVFEFPFTDGYINWINLKSQKIPSGKKPRYFWTNFYGEIIKNQIEPAGIKIPDEWFSKLISFRTMAVYLIADSSETLLYIGKCEYPPIIRLFDRMIPKKFNPRLNNVPEIWDNYLSKGIKIKCAYIYDLKYDPEILESFLLKIYFAKHGRLPKYNKRRPK